MKKNILRKISGLLQLIVPAMLLTLLMAFSPSRYEADTDWTIMAQENGITAYAMESKCDKGDVYLFKFENTTDKVVSLNYTLEATLDPTFPPIKKEVVLQPNQTVSGNCDTMWETTLPNSHPKRGDLKSRLNVSLNTNQ
jgi:hypothetical protein